VPGLRGGGCPVPSTASPAGRTLDVTRCPGGAPVIFICIRYGQPRNEPARLGGCRGRSRPPGKERVRPDGTGQQQGAGRAATASVPRRAGRAPRHAGASCTSLPASRSPRDGRASWSSPSASVRIVGSARAYLHVAALAADGTPEHGYLLPAAGLKTFHVQLPHGRSVLRASEFDARR
jgi:hypothetical protein